MSDENRKFNPDAMKVVGQMFGGLGAGIGQGIASKMNERIVLAAAALQGILADHTINYGPRECADLVVGYADAVLKRLDEVPDPRIQTGKMPGIATVEK